MTIFVYLALLALLASAIVMLLLRMDAQRLANLVRISLPAAIGVLGVVMALLGRPAVGFALAGTGFTMLMRSLNRLRAVPSQNQKSRVRTAALEMELDLDSGLMNGLVLAGTFEGSMLDDLSEKDLFKLRGELESDPESVQVLEAYLDRRMPTWRDDFDAHMDKGLGSAPASGAMSKEEAYEILGLAAGASEAEIREAHRSLMKRVHPDAGGSVFLAARINEAKDILLRRHSN